MKKLLSVALALCVILSTSLTAFAAAPPKSEKVWEQIEGAAAYLTQDVEKYTVDTATDYVSIVIWGDSSIEKYDDAFIADVKANLEQNDGKIVSAYGESLATYGAVMIALSALGEDPADFYGFNIEKAFLALDPTVAYANPYCYSYIIMGLNICYDESAVDFLETVCDTFVSTYYTMGKGMDYYGYSCDNTAHFIDALSGAAWFTDKYNDILNDAIKVLDTYKVKGGYCYSPEYGTEPNANSTALALMAHSIWINEETEIEEFYDVVNGIYADLCTFEGSSAGIFTYDGEDNMLATKDALNALSYYYIDALMQEDDDYIDDNEEEEKPAITDKKDNTTTTKPAAEKTTQATKTNTSKKSPATGAGTGVIALASAISFAGFAVVCAKKKEQ